MSGPIETISAIVITSALAVAAVLIVPTPREKPAEPKPDAKQTTAVEAPAPTALEVVNAPVQKTEDERLTKLENSVAEIKADQRQLNEDIRALVEEIKSK